MNHRERIITALNHQEPDRCPMQVSMTPEFAERLRAELAPADRVLSLSHIPELIEIGLDVLNPVQPACMDPARLKQRYGDRLCFWGSIDEQSTSRSVRLRTIGQSGGLIIGPTHHVQLDTPMANFWAMIEAITGTRYDALGSAT